MAYVPDATDATQPTEAQFVKSAAAEFRALKAYVQALASAGGVGVATPGQISMFTCQNPPAGWLELDGSLKLRATFPNLYDAAVAGNGITLDATWLTGYFGYYSYGDGSSTFRLPDMRGVFPRGWNHGKAGAKYNAGRALGTLEGATRIFDNFGNTNAEIVVPTTGHLTSGSDEYTTLDGAVVWNVVYAAGSNVTGVQASSVRPTNISLMFCVKT